MRLVVWCAAMVAGLSTLVSAATVEVTWTAPTAGGPVAQYRLERKAEVCTGTGAFATLVTVPSTQLLHNDATATDGATYAYRVAALRSDGQAGPVSDCSDIVVPTALPGKPGKPTLRLGAVPPTGRLTGPVYYLPTNQYAFAKGAGIDVAHEWYGAAMTGLLDLAKQHGLLMDVELGIHVVGGLDTPAKITNTVNQLKAHPSASQIRNLLLIDEPDLAPPGTFDPAWVKSMYQASKAAWANAPVCVLVRAHSTTWEQAKLYLAPDMSDCVYYDPYIYAAGPISQVGSEGLRIRNFIGPTKSLTAIIQAGNPGWGGLSLPPPDAVRDMGLSALNNGVNLLGLWTENQWTTPTWQQIAMPVAAWDAWTPAAILAAPQRLLSPGLEAPVGPWRRDKRPRR